MSTEVYSTPVSTPTEYQPAGVSKHEEATTGKEREATGSTQGTAAPEYEHHPVDSSKPVTVANTANEKHVPAPLDVKAPLTDAETTMSPTVISPNPATPKSAEAERHERAATAESSLTAKTKQKLSSAEIKQAKQMSKVLEKEQNEANTSLKVLIKELAKLQAVHKKAVRAENKANTKHSKAVKTEHKTHMKLLTAQGKHEKAVADLKTRTEALAAKKEHAGVQGNLMNQKTTELEEVRAKKAVEDREREAKLQQLSMNPTGM